MLPLWTLFPILLLVVSSERTEIDRFGLAEDEPSLDFWRRLAWYSAVAYCPAETLAQWKCKICWTVRDFIFVTPSYDPVSDSFGYVGHNPLTQEIVIAFRGTDPSKIQNWITNINFVQTNYPDFPGAKVHLGFYSAYTVHKALLKPAVDLLLKTLPDSYRIRITGHSLGGALAQMAAIDLFARTEHRDRVDLVTFGQPRLGNQIFSGEASRRLNMTRITHHLDPVPHVPLEQHGFVHTGLEIFFELSRPGFSDPGPWKNCTNGPEDPDCADGEKFPILISDHVDYVGIAISGSCCEYQSRCPDGTWGMCCELTCNPDFHCIHNPACLKEIGTCAVSAPWGLRCADGFWGFDDPTVCSDDTLSNGIALCNRPCSESMHCEDPKRCQSCTGGCGNPNNAFGCQFGWWGCEPDIHGVDCDDFTPTGVLRCDKPCSPTQHCFADRCLKKTGSCDYDMFGGCIDGWWGCEGDCETSYRKNGLLRCDKQCSPQQHCFDSKLCRKNAGGCYQNRCQDGWWGMEGNIARCNKPCQCKNPQSACEIQTGACF